MWYYRLCIVYCILSMGQSHLNSICAQSDREEVGAIWESMWSSFYTGRKTVLASEVFKRMFYLYPKLEDHFPLMNVTLLNSPDFRGHAVRIVHGFDIPMTFLRTNYEVLMVQLEYLGNQHTHYDPILPEYFTVMRESFETVFVQAIPSFMPYAWRRCVQAMQDLVISAMSEQSEGK